ncbi:SDR family NAD(P)-dependent oxidoreductase [Vibrio penaeicida]|uniref:Oxidoreductase n=1 Tax=Vibrio penaeicida TaxID=104609 RepID=A0AAV5NPP2_9VIBR|nr:SDR family NAD(P)-dependent oxidoreductase [Vibrio penaeicida]RTZ19857.1 SDR family NAD(P)-dependent oxidoreductase [Vibrio penaeicida]GLQ72615.1 oxidoreductase [Vibrio penaeicida]
MVKHAIITGASRGIGKALALYFAGQGYSLSLMAKSKDNLVTARTEILELNPKIDIDIFPVDFAQPEKVEQTLTQILNVHPRVDVLVNSAGILTAGNIDVSLEALSTLINVNLVSTIQVTNQIAQQMKKQGHGHIFNLGSTAGLSPVSKIAAYSASKAAIVSYTESLYTEMLSCGVQVCCLCPSVVDTDMTNDGRIDNSEKIEIDDLSKAVDFVMNLSSGAAMAVLPIRCKVIDLEKA